jgi:hypothetical protein
MSPRAVGRGSPDNPGPAAMVASPLKIKVRHEDSLVTRGQMVSDGLVSRLERGLAGTVPVPSQLY